MIAAVDLAAHADGTGDMPLVVAGPAKLGILALWPHARPWRIVAPQPMLRAVPDARAVAALIARACGAVQPEARAVTMPARAPRTPAFAEAAAA